MDSDSATHDGIVGSTTAVTTAWIEFGMARVEFPFSRTPLGWLSADFSPATPTVASAQRPTAAGETGRRRAA